ncbi:MAG: SDR family oxidoreductase, partial [Firmicutes bacterium]|nr:SDR family oxidoreductase [Bacillota bacterium]
MNVQPSLLGKRVLVTGGSRGIGEATVRLLARLGARVAFTYRHRQEEAETLRHNLEAEGHITQAFAADQRSRRDAETVAEALDATWGGLDAFVSNAGVWLPTPAELEDETNLDVVLETNLTGLFRWHAALVPLLKRQGGSLVLVSSTAGQRGEAGYGAYAASKGAVISLTKTLATELGPAGIRVNCVAPGWVDTDLSAPALRTDPEQRRKVETLFPLGHIP